MSILRRLLSPIAGVVTAVTMAVLVTGAVLMRRAVVERAHARAERITWAEHARFKELIRTSDHRDFQPLVESLGLMPDVAAARLLDSTGRIEVSSQPTEIGAYARNHLNQQDRRGDRLGGADRFGLWGPTFIHTAEPLRNERVCQTCHEGPSSEVLGVLDLDVAVNPHTLGLTTFTALSLLLGGCYLLGVVATAVPRIQSVVVRPVQGLIGAFERVEAGDLSITAGPAGTREVNRLVEGFNRMVSRLRQAKVAEEEAHRLQMERAEQLAAVGQLAAGLAHEFRNPLSSVKAVVEVLSDEEDLGDTRRTVLRQAASELDRIDRIVKDLLQYARPKTPVLEPFDLNAAVREVAEVTMVGAAGRAEVSFDVWPGPLAAAGDPDMTRQVLVNLFLNACQAALLGKTPRVEIATGRDDTIVWCRVRDHGTGVPAARAQSIFQPFGTTKARGTGLGLSISRRLIELQGGRLTLDNPGEAGASFTFTLPADAGQTA